MRVLLLWRMSVSAHLRVSLSSIMRNSTKRLCPKNPMLFQTEKDSGVKRVAGPEQVRNGSVCVATSCVVGAPVLNGDASKDGDDSPITQESAAVLEVVDSDEYAFVVGSSTPVRANAGFESERFNFREALSHAFVTDTGGVLDTSGLALRRLLSLTSLCFSFSCKIFS